MRRNCVECRHCNINTENLMSDIALVCVRLHFEYPLEGVAMDEIRQTLRTATDCLDYEAVEPECTCKTTPWRREPADGVFEATLHGVKIDPTGCPVHGTAGRPAGPAEIDLELL